MLSTQYRLRLDKVCKLIAEGKEVNLTEMIWARQRAANPNMKEGGTDDFLNKMGLGESDPSDYREGFDSADDIGEWFNRKKPDDWRQRD